MQPSEKLSAENTASLGNTGKRKSHDHSNQNRIATSSQRRSSAVPIEQTIPDTAPGHSSKRLKTSHSSEIYHKPTAAVMSKLMAQKSKVTIDLTSTTSGGRSISSGRSNFEPHKGAKRLVIKNLRTTSQRDVDDYYEKTWRELDAAVTAVFERQQPVTPFEVLCRGVEATCRRGKAGHLSAHLRDRSKVYLEKQLLPIIESESGTSNVDALRTVHKYWTVWNEQSVGNYSIWAFGA